MKTYPLAEEAVAKDKWLSHDREVMTFPPMPEEFVEEGARFLF
jgi:hypothetical protein